MAPLQERSRARGCGRRTFRPSSAGWGFGQVKLGLMHEILGQTPYGPVVVRQQRSRFGQRRAPGDRHRELRATRSSAPVVEPLLDGRPPQRLLHDRARARVRPDPAHDVGRARRRRVRLNGHKWFTSNGSVADFLIVMAVTNPDVHPYQGSSMLIVPVKTPGVDIVRDVATMEDPDRALRPVRQPRRDHLPRRPHPGREPGGAGGRRVPAGPTAPRAGPHPPLHAVAGPVPSRLRHALRAGRLALRARLVLAEKQTCRTGWPIPWRRCRRRGS
jgi:hypothetical protein